MLLRFFVAAVSFILAGSAHAGNRDSASHLILAPACLLSEAGISNSPVAVKNNQVLFSADDVTVGALVRARPLFFQGATGCGNFQDVTRAWRTSGLSAEAFLVKQALPVRRAVRDTHTLRYASEVNQHLANINPQDMWTNLATLTAFKDRYANSRYGVRVSQWLHQQLVSLSKERKDVSIYTVPTTGYKQPSIVLKIGDSSEPGVVISAEMDTPDSSWWFFTRMPGAGYNGSGAVAVLEAAKTLLSSDMHFKKPIYFVWYGAEMYGRAGSMEVVNLFQFQGRKMAEAVLHLECTGLGRNRTMWLMEDYADPQLNLWMKQLVNVYVRQAVLFEHYDDAGFSHASWTGAGVSATTALGDRVPILGRMIGSYESDTMSKLSLEHMTDYLKLAIAFAVEGAEPLPNQ